MNNAWSGSAVWRTQFAPEQDFFEARWGGHQTSQKYRPKFSEVRPKVLRSIGPSSQKYRTKFSELEDNIVNTHKTHIITRKNRFSEPTAKVLRTSRQSSEGGGRRRSELREPAWAGDNSGCRGGSKMHWAKSFGRCHNRNQVMELKQNRSWESWKNWGSEPFQKHKKSNFSKSTPRRFSEVGPPCKCT